MGKMPRKRCMLRATSTERVTAMIGQRGLYAASSSDDLSHTSALCLYKHAIHQKYAILCQRQCVMQHISSTMLVVRKQYSQ